jgi:hypothetical protein
MVADHDRPKGFGKGRDTVEILCSDEICSGWEQANVGMLVLDTHALIWAHKGVRISKKVERQITRAAARHELFVSAITPWEVA